MTNVNLGTEIPGLNLKIAEDMALDASLELFHNVKEEVSTAHLDKSTQPDGEITLWMYLHQWRNL